ncbi:5-formyltetrahydrofolate cyclo-ligase [Phenylobacterium sp.]|uniref:5-formyltetrahydrofolate cyclo-ligase n=1 Tax=Phenylobacterium sp. TaxID=1871053 RepID=UPI002C3524B4|nr:5-formyltetrahydrofolate cyclo-ligase [Phenylobacterium sp.]HLZ75372.1 5-formyltetrahydrofolate cyclo-ligase [Phenylobacterium sp.]
MTPPPNKQVLDKKKLRIEMRALRRHLADENPDAAIRAARRLPVSRFSRFSLVGAYCAQGSELDPGPILQAILELNAGHAQAALPVALDKNSPLKFRLWRPDQPLEKDACGIPSPPASAPEVLPNLLITPLLAFDRRGGRLGQGGGHYDRTLKALRRQRPVFVLGVAFSGQEIDEAPMDAHDQRLDAIVTETEFIEVVKEGR